MPKQKTEPLEESIHFVWLVAYIDSAFLHKVEAELKRYPEYKDIEAYIPTVKVLKKTFKGKQEFDEVPLLFNYGFFKVPRKYAIHSSFLDSMRTHVSCIYAWVKDPLKSAARSKVQRRKEADLENGLTKRTDSDIEYATADSKEVTELLKNQFKYSTYDADDLNKIKPGSIITLRGYPFDGIEAELVDLNFNKREAIVKIRMFDTMKDISVSFDNVFFTMYTKSNHDDSISTEASLEQLEENHKLDKVMFKNSDHGKN